MHIVKCHPCGMPHDLGLSNSQGQHVVSKVMSKGMPTTAKPKSKQGTGVDKGGKKMAMKGASAKYALLPYIFIGEF